MHCFSTINLSLQTSGQTDMISCATTPNGIQAYSQMTIHTMHFSVRSSRPIPCLQLWCVTDKKIELVLEKSSTIFQ